MDARSPSKAPAGGEDAKTRHLFCGGADAGTDASPFDRLSYKLTLGDGGATATQAWEESPLYPAALGAVGRGGGAA